MVKVKAGIVFWCIFILSTPHILYGDSLNVHVREAFRYFDLRAENAKECQALPTNIDKSISYFEKALSLSPTADPNVVTGLLKAYEFKGARTAASRDAKIKVFEKGMALGKDMMSRYPDHSGIKYWYMANLGRWAQEVGVMKAARAHVASEIKEIAEWIMAHDPNYDEAGAYRILGTMNIELPRIPFLLSWPSDDDGLKLLAEAYRLSPSHYGNCLRYARALRKEGQDDKALTILLAIKDGQPREKTYIEDLQNLQEAKKLLAELE